MDIKEEAIKQDAGKMRWDLLPLTSLREVVAVYAFGAAKYSDRNWEKGLAYSRCYAALMRHITSFWEGEDTDYESGLHHLAHAVFWCLALMFYQSFGRGTDDRR